MKTSKDKVKPSYNIILVGETGVGKSSVLELIANVLAGNDIDHYNFDILEHTTEQGGSKNQTQTNSIRFYELASRNGIVVSAGFFECGKCITPSQGSHHRHTRVGRHSQSSAR